MTVALKKWGNSLALRIPKDITQTLDIANNSLMELDVHNGTLIIKPKKENYLESMLSQINSNNLHKEVEIDEKVGNEEW